MVGRMGGTGQQNTHWQLFLTVGFCGSFTTFSTWILDIEQLLERTHTHAAAGDLLLSIGLALAGLLAGIALGHSHLLRP
jgi:CrcB protein